MCAWFFNGATTTRSSEYNTISSVKVVTTGQGCVLSPLLFMNIIYKWLPGHTSQQVFYKIFRWHSCCLTIKFILYLWKVNNNYNYNYNYIIWSWLRFTYCFNNEFICICYTFFIPVFFITFLTNVTNKFPDPVQWSFVLYCIVLYCIVMLSYW